MASYEFNYLKNICQLNYCAQKKYEYLKIFGIKLVILNYV